VDVSSAFNVTIDGPHPVLLSNGNPVSSIVRRMARPMAQNLRICLHWLRAQEL
jgi:hypothetical protein